MKIIACTKAKENYLVEMSVDEIKHFAGFCSNERFKDSLGFENSGYNLIEDLDQAKAVDIPVSEIFVDAQETLSAFSDLKKSLNSIKSRIGTLTNKMENLTTDSRSTKQNGN